MKRLVFVLICLFLIALAGLPGSARAQLPLPADLFILTSERSLIRIDAAFGTQTVISSQEQPIIDFAIAPDGAWYAYRTSTNNALIVTAIDNLSGYVLEFDIAAPLSTSGGQTLAWAPDASALAYSVPEGVRVAQLGAGDYGTPQFTTVQGGPWVDLRWSDPESLIATDAAGRPARIALQGGLWTVEPLTSAPTLAAPAVAAALTAQGVQLANGTLVPGTEGAVAFAWGPLPPRTVAGLVLPRDLYYVASDDAGTPRVWRLGRSGEPAAPITPAGEPVATYAIAPDNAQIVYVTGSRVIAAQFDGMNRRELASLPPEEARLGLAWSPDGAHIALSDSRGVWQIAANGSEPPRLIVQNTIDQANPLAIRVYSNPQWSPDGTRLLVVIGFYEGGVLGVIDQGGVVELSGVIASQGRWTNTGQVVTWSAYWGYETPGLYLLDPTTPNATPQTVLDTRYPVGDAIQRAAGDWFVLNGSASDMGPRFWRVLAAPTLNSPFTRSFDVMAGGFAENPRLAADQGDTVMLAGLRNITYDAQYAMSGDLVLIHMRTGDTVQVQTRGPAREVRWGW